jgi:hypothetical protein
MEPENEQVRSVRILSLCRCRSRSSRLELSIGFSCEPIAFEMQKSCLYHCQARSGNNTSQALRTFENCDSLDRQRQRTIFLRIQPMLRCTRSSIFMDGISSSVRRCRERVDDVIVSFQIMSIHLFNLQRYLTHADQCLRHPASVTRWHQVYVSFIRIHVEFEFIPLSYSREYSVTCPNPRLQPTIG